MNVILIGPQGCGKGTQAAKLTEEYSFKHLSTGDALREEVARGTTLGLRAKELMNKGALVPDELVNDIIKGAVERHHQQGLLFDGYPRTLTQAAFLHRIVHIDAVIDLNISDEESVRRISARYNCPVCKEIYNTISKPPRIPGVCDKDGAKLFQREDDRPEEVRRRLRDFHSKTEPIMTFFKQRGVRAHWVNGEQPIAQVYAELKRALEKT